MKTRLLKKIRKSQSLSPEYYKNFASTYRMQTISNVWNQSKELINHLYKYKPILKIMTPRMDFWGLRIMFLFALLSIVSLIFFPQTTLIVFASCAFCALAIFLNETLR